LLLLAHLGLTAGAVRISQRFVLKRRVDYRLVALMAILPDLVDRPLHIFVIPGAQSGRLFAHTLIFSLVLLASLVAIRRDLWIYGILPLFHVLMDFQGMSAEQFFWPFLGADLSNVHISAGPAETVGQSYADRVGDRIHDILGTYTGAGFWSILIDAVGLVALLVLAVKSGLRDRGRVARLAETGDTQTQVSSTCYGPTLVACGRERPGLTKPRFRGIRGMVAVWFSASRQRRFRQ
jgi:hypothetical protein